MGASIESTIPLTVSPTPSSLSFFLLPPIPPPSITRVCNPPWSSARASSSYICKYACTSGTFHRTGDPSHFGTRVVHSGTVLAESQGYFLSFLPLSHARGPLTPIELSAVSHRRETKTLSSSRVASLLSTMLRNEESSRRGLASPMTPGGRKRRDRDRQGQKKEDRIRPTTLFLLGPRPG